MCSVFVIVGMWIKKLSSKRIPAYFCTEHVSYLYNPNNILMAHCHVATVLFQCDWKIFSLSPAINSQYSEFSCPVKRIKFPNFGIKFRTIQKILVFGIFFRNYGNSLVAQTEQNFTIFGI